MISRAALASLLTCALARSHLRNSTSHGALRSDLDALKAHTSLNSTHEKSSHSNAPCQCQANSPTWPAVARAAPKCMFIDLGAADGNSFKAFLRGSYGPVQNCPSGQWEAFLVEANPQFTHSLNALAAQYPNQVHAFGSTAAYSCKGTTSFAIDPDAGHNHWGSSMKRQFGSKTVTVPTMNVIELIATKVIQSDWVMLKVDIEGAEYDLLPCLAQFSRAGLVDRMFLEEHDFLQGQSVYTYAQYGQAKQHLKAVGVDIPPYFSHTM